MLYITQSQRIELLFAAMQDFLAAHPPAGVLEAQQLIVPSHGIGVWLRQQLASQQGICARVNSDFLGTYQWQLYARVLGKDTPSHMPLSMQVMQWRIFAYLQQQLVDMQLGRAVQSDAQRLESLFQSIRSDKPVKQQRQLWRMAAHIAQVFAAYVVYRPDWLSRWGQGEQLNIRAALEQGEQGMPAWMVDNYEHMQGWQQLLWQQLFHADFVTRQQAINRFWQTLQQHPDKRQVLPKCLTVFTAIQLAPQDLLFIRRLAQYVDVHVLHYNPSQEYWEDSVDPLWLKRFALRNPRAAALRESRHPLLTRMGKQARDVFGLLAELSGNDEGEWNDVFPDYYPDTLLGQLQQDVLYLVDPLPHSKMLYADDRSIQIHACHSSLRQLEVLREQLIDWFAADITRQPADVLVLVPNLPDIVPLIRSVFAPHNDSGKFIPVNVTGIATSDAEQLWQAVTGRFMLLDARFSIEDFADWLALEGVQQAYALSREDVQRLTDLLVQAGFRRGFDATHLSPTLSTQDKDSRFTLQFALNRLLLGMVMPVQALHADILPLQEVMRSDFELINTLSRIYNDLAARRDYLQQPAQPVLDWLDLLRQDMALDFEFSVNSAGWLAVHQAFDELQKSIAITLQDQQASLDENLQQPDPDVATRLKLPLRFVLDEVAQLIAQAPPGSLPTGRITFSRLGTLRPLPYSLVVMLNLDAGVFPSREVKNSFDLMNIMPARRGDRSRQEDDQGAFLDGLLLAQDACWLFYNGFDVSDPHPRQPSGTLQELIDHLLMLIKPTTEQPRPIQQLLQQHTLEPYEQANFQPQSTAFSGTWSVVAQQIQQHFPGQVWQDHPLASELVQQLPFSRVIRNLQKPAQHFLAQARVQSIRMLELPATFEPLSLNALDHYHLRALHQQQKQLKQGFLQDRLPVGNTADAYWKKSQLEARKQQQRLQQFAPQASITTTQILDFARYKLAIEVPAEDTRLWLSQYPYGIRGTRQLAFWLEHLAWQVWRQTSVEDVAAGNGQRIAVYSKQCLQLPPIAADQAVVYLKHWLQAWQRAGISPWVLPPDLALNDNAVQAQASDDLDQPVWQRSIKNLAQVLEVWKGESFDRKGAPPKREQEDCALHDDWQLILRGQDVVNCLLERLREDAVPLYQPLKYYMQVLKQ